MCSPALGKLTGIDHSMDVTSAGAETFQVSSLTAAMAASVVAAREDYFARHQPEALETMIDLRCLLRYDASTLSPTSI